MTSATHRDDDEGRDEERGGEQGGGLSGGPEGAAGDVTGDAPEAGRSAPAAPPTRPSASGSWDDGLIARRAQSGATAIGGRRTGGADGPAGGGRSRFGGSASGRGGWSGGAVGRGRADGDDGYAAGGASVRASGRAGARYAAAQRAESAAEEAARHRAVASYVAAVDVRDRERERADAGDAGSGLRIRLDALRELVGLSRTRLRRRELAEAGQVLEAAAARHRLSGEHTVVALAGATGSGKSSLFNALTGASYSEVGVRRPTTAEPVACAWATGGAGGRVGAEGLLDRLGIPPYARHALPPSAEDPALSGLVLLDLPDHDSAATGHRQQVDRLLGLVDAVIWVVDPEKYADAVLHERYLRPLAGYAEVTFVVLNQVDRLPGDAADQVLDDLRRLLDEDGLALGEHGEPGAAVMSLSALTGQGVPELRETLGQFVADRGAADRRLAADVDGAAARLREVCVAEGRTGLTEGAREAFEDRLADAVGAVAVGRVAEGEWLRHAEHACGAPWARLSRWHGGGHPGQRSRARQRPRGAQQRPRAGTGRGSGARPGSGPETFGEHSARTGQLAGRLAGQRAAGRAGRGPARSAAGGRAAGGRAGAEAPAAARPVVEQAVRTVAGAAAEGLPAPWALAVREAAARGARGLPNALDDVAAAAARAAVDERPPRPTWWTAAAGTQALLLLFQLLGAIWLMGAVSGVFGPAHWRPALLLTAVSVAGGPVIAWACRLAARGPARRYGQEAERRLRSTAAGCGRARVLEPVAAELLRYREVRDQYAVAADL
ncbi:GTPase [Streptomyces sp. H27-D2]|uniref:GTPase n=1 Tax=Streptomyces sp. H27-D2 TaxID=3046304 RepID=UPI002DB5DDEB|nr:GTPase [Streptomyces sp. H27-D2]MEC4021095.1 GTPase [Streptomyces sp. H27-D2]